MHQKLDALRSRIQELETELIRNTLEKEHEFSYKLRDKTAHFTEAAKARHKRFRLSIHQYLLNSRLFVFLTAPFIWACLLPIALLDLTGSLYQAICFPIYGIPKVRRRDYLVFDRHLLGYLNFIEKLNCEYCSYANGILAYFTEIAARTEQHWCPIKHAAHLKAIHSRYQHFIDFGDAETYRQQIEKIRRDYEDLKSTLPAHAGANRT